MRARGLLVAASLAGLVACTNSAERLAEEAEALVAAGRYDSAARIWREALDHVEGGEEDPLDRALRFRGRMRLGELYNLYLASPHKGIQHYRMAERLAIDSDQAIAAARRIAEIYETTLPDPVRASAEYIRIATDNAGHPDAGPLMVRAAEIYLHQGRYEQTYGTADWLATHYPGSPLVAEAHLIEAGALRLAGKIQEAKSRYELLLALDLSPALAARAHFELGTCEEELGNLGAALEEYRAAREDYPNPLVVTRRISAMEAVVETPTSTSTVSGP